MVPGSKGIGRERKKERKKERKRERPIEGIWIRR
jgi:hypothetical protein